MPNPPRHLTSHHLSLIDLLSWHQPSACPCPRRNDDEDALLADAPHKVEEEEKVMEALPLALGALLGAACAAGRLRELSLEVENLTVSARPQPHTF